jgi:hypothetical protein
MSKVAIEGNALGSGTFTIASPNTNSSYTLSLPENTGTILTQNSTPAFASTIGVGGATAAASGAGITFPATQSASSDANTLDDYEEGDWTPTLTTSGTNFTSVTYNTTNTHGRYTKIGRVVILQGRVATTAVTKGSASGVIQVGNLPFATSGSPATALSAGVVGFSAGWDGDVPSTVMGSAGGAALNLAYRTAANGNTTDLAVSDVSTTTNDARFTIAYYV